MGWVKTWFLVVGASCGVAVGQLSGQEGTVKRFKYDVVSIREVKGDPKAVELQDLPDGFSMKGLPLESVIPDAYGVDRERVSGWPGWATFARFDIEAKMDSDTTDALRNLPKQQQDIERQLMMQSLLEERFKLKVHRGTEVRTTYQLVFAKGGSKMTKSQGDPNTLGDESDNDRGGQTTMKITNMSMTAFALVMQFFMDKPVVDQTGLAGRWDFQWTWTTDESRASPDANAAPGMFTAIQEQLGLKLDATKAQADAFVVDHVEQPSAN